MNETYENIIEQDRQSLRTGLVHFLHRSGAQASPRETKQYERPSQGDGRPRRVLLVSPTPMFGTTLVELLRQIDVQCQITRMPRISETFFVDDQEPSLVVIDLDIFPRDGKALIGTMAAGHPSTAFVGFSNSDDQKLIDVTVESGVVIYFSKASPRLLIEGVLRLVIDGQHFRALQNDIGPRAHAYGSAFAQGRVGARSSISRCWYARN